MAVVPVQQTLVVDAQRPSATNAENDENNKNVRRRETIFGPDVGEDDEPGWTKPDEGAKIDVNVVKGWVEKAKSEEVSTQVNPAPNVADCSGYSRYHHAPSSRQSQATNTPSAAARASRRRFRHRGGHRRCASL
jgi:hypothetical protein